MQQMICFFEFRTTRTLCIGQKYGGKFDNCPAAGCPSVPVIKGETAGDQAYSYDVIWSVESDYSLLQHEVGWPH